MPGDGASGQPGHGQVDMVLDLVDVIEVSADLAGRLVPSGKRADVQRLELRLLEQWVGDAEGLGDGAVQMLEPAALEEMPHFREALRRGETQFATSAPLGTDPASGRIAAAVPIHSGGCTFSTSRTRPGQSGPLRRWSCRWTSRPCTAPPGRPAPRCTRPSRAPPAGARRGLRGCRRGRAGG